MNKIFAVVGADARQQAVRRALQQAGHTVLPAGQAARADVLVLPIAFDSQRIGLAALLRAARPGVLVLGGRCPASAWRLAAQAGAVLVDYYQREELALLNAVPTAEGCIGILLRERTRTLWGARVVVTGFGRVAQALAPRLAALGAQVTVAARSPAQLALARTMGLAACPLAQLPAACTGVDIAVNTVPALVLGKKALRQLPPGALLVELASSPGGIDLAAATVLERRVIAAPGLPAVCAPESAGAFVAQAVLQMVAERQAAPGQQPKEETP